jgi:inorganic triphosphatase YgiF
MPRELELKMDLDIAAMRQISEWLLKRRNTTGVAQQLRTVYFDTNDFALRRSGISLRVRKAGDNYLQTIKLAESGGAGYFDRPEWETKVSSFHPDLAAARKTGLKPFRIKHLSKLIATAFEIRTRRTTYAISDGGARLELALDEGRVLGKGHGARFCELEIEVKQGKRDDLFRVARAIGRVAPLRLGFRTKADRGYAAIHANENGVFRAEKIDLRPKTRAEAAFRLIARDCLRQLVANVPATLEGNAEALHQMRVSIRRLRAGKSVFSELIRDRRLGKLKAEFRWISRILGTARDLDVLLDETLKQQPNGSPKGGLPDIVRAFRVQRDEAYSDVSEALNSTRFRTLIFETLEWVECGGWQRKRGALAIAQREQAIVTHAARELRRRYKKLTKAAADFRKLDPAARHRVRIRAKKLRYAVEFFGSVFPGNKHAQRHATMLSSLKELQSRLGALNDISTHEKLMFDVAHSRKLNGKLKTAETFTAGIIYRSEEARIEQQLDAANAITSEIIASKPFWD